jgi:lipoprotein-releasing system ATP-binding protein
MSDPILELNALEKTYHRDRPNQINVLCGANLEVKPGEIIALVAPSGAGKSTLLHIAGLLDTPDEGEVKFNGEHFKS